ncbi:MULTISPECIES: ATP-binding protein [unclassified Pseudomonas]|uniref:sensor histidine kinase n=1 Tax=unclassified Pseudomonas TaxID=196821 RepID=UPI00244D2572|nr:MULTISPECIES: ATP-binding protein [unclassified Pseudomonas]MDG9928350.1 ATP-binding protein [Pseudomonas sp. GD04042]MDH0481086.1 ATP-binding protein [Pseudomonas sp. GD04015]MDH0604422.1 ATP-binding protein [Pseudomonas sp. GD03869]
MIADQLALNGIPGRRVLRLYHLYRVAVGLALILLISTKLDSELLELAHVQLFRYGSWAYLIVNVLVAVLMHRPRHLLQVFGLALLDVLMLCALFYSAGGTPSGIGNLLIVAVAIANILLRGRIGLLIAATAAIGMLSLTFYLSLTRPAVSAQFVQAGALGGLCFAAAILLQGLTQRLQMSESLAEQRAVDVASLEALNSLILQRMRTGILVLDKQHRVLLANQGALGMLGRGSLEGKVLDPHCPELVKRLQQWLHNPTLRPQSLQAMPDGPVLQPSFIPLQRGEDQHTLVFLDDISQITQQAQQLKLASLGRLTAGIAHEIRNPLGAISHAAQLLQESEDLEEPDRRLAQIIQDHSRRMNMVIENVLQLSRRRQAEPQLLDLKYWMHRFASEFRSSARLDQTLHLETHGSGLQTRMDPHQLTQVLNNLVQNGLRYSAQAHQLGQVWLKLYRDEESDLPTLEILDDGPGVAPEQMQHIFEPFYTTDNKGTGLGLYISRELCESNQARLDYKPREGGGSCFRITFAHPRKLS